MKFLFVIKMKDQQQKGQEKSGQHSEQDKLGQQKMDNERMERERTDRERIDRERLDREKLGEKGQEKIHSDFNSRLHDPNSQEFKDRADDRSNVKNVGSEAHIADEKNRDQQREKKDLKDDSQRRETK